MKVLLIDNYDSFTFNLYHYISSFNIKVDVVRNDKINSKEIIKKSMRSQKNQLKINEIPKKSMRINEIPKKSMLKSMKFKTNQGKHQ